MRILTIWLLFISLSASSQTGTLSGNVFWKYNNYVGNRADAASEVYLYRDSATPKIQVQTDVQGNFKFDNLAPGTYLVIVKSQSTTDDWQHNYIQLKFAPLRHYTGVDEKLFDKSLYDSIEMLKQVYYSAVTEKVGAFAVNRHLKKVESSRKDFVAEIRRVYRNVSVGDPLYLVIEPFQEFPKKISIKEVTIAPNQTTSVVVDFGTTYI